MPPARRGVIDSMKVGLGIDMTQLGTDIGTAQKKLQAGFELTPKINVPGNDVVKGWLSALDTSVNRSNQKGIKVPLTFDKDLAVNNYRAAISAVQKEVRPITVPVHFRREADATRPPYGETGGGGGGGGGGRGGPSAGPSRGGGGGTSRSAPQRGTTESTAQTAEAKRLKVLEEKLKVVSEAIEESGEKTAKAAGLSDEGEPKATKGRSQKKTKAKKSKVTKQQANRSGLSIVHGRTDDSSVDVPDYGEPPDDEEEEVAAAPAKPKRARSRSKKKPLAASRPQGPLEMVDGEVATDEQRAEARAAAKAGPNIGRQRDSRPAGATFDRRTKKWVQRGKATPDSAPKRADRASELMENLGINEELKGRTFGSTDELFDAVLGAAQGKLSAPIAPLEPGQRNRRFYNKSPFEREQAIDAERSKASKLLTSVVEIEKDTARSGEQGITPKQRQLAEDRIQRNLEQLEEVAPGLSEAFTERNAGKARTAVLASRGLTGRRATREQTKLKGRFADRSRSSIDTAMEDYPVEFTLDALIGSLFKAPSLKKAGGVAVADESGQARSAPKKRRTRAQQGRDLATQVTPAQRSEAQREKDRILTARRERMNPLSEEARDAFQPIDVVDVNPYTSEPSNLATEQKSFEQAEKTLKAAKTSDEKRAKLSTMPPSVEDRAGFSTPPPGESIKAVMEQAAAKRAAAKTMQERVAALPIDFEGKQYAGRTSFGVMERPWDIETGKPITQSMAERLKSDTKITPAKLPGLPDVAAAYARQGTPEAVEEAKRYLRLKESGFASGGFMQRLFGKKPEEGIRYPRYDTPEPKTAPRGGQALAKYGEGPMSPWVKNAVFGDLDPKDMTGRAMGGPDEAWRRSTGYRGRAEALSDALKHAGNPYTDDEYYQGVRKGIIGVMPGVGLDDPRMAGRKMQGILERAADSEIATLHKLYGTSLEKFYGVHGKEQGINFKSPYSVWRPQAEQAPRAQTSPGGQDGWPLDEWDADAGARAGFVYSKNAMGGLQERLIAAKIQQAYDAGNIAEGQALQKQLEQMKGGWGSPRVELPMSPFMRLIQEKKLGSKDLTGMAMGGRASSLADLPSIAAQATSITEVGEQGREAIVGLRGGGSFVVPHHQLNPFKKMLGMADGGVGDFEAFTGSVAGIPQDFVRPRDRSKMPPLSESMTFAQVNYDHYARRDARLGSGGGYQEGRDPKIHVAATRDEALQTLNLVNDLAKEMQVTFKYVPRLNELVGTSGREYDVDGTFGPGGRQQGKFITAYPAPDQAQEFASRLDEALRSAGLGKLAAVAPSEIQYAPDTPMTHRSSGGDRYGSLGGYDESAGRPDLIGTRSRNTQSGEQQRQSEEPQPAPSLQEAARAEHASFRRGWSSPYPGGEPDPILVDDLMSDRSARPKGLFKRRRVPAGEEGAGRFAPGYEPAYPPLEMLDADVVTNKGVGKAGLRVMGGEGKTFATRRGVAGERAFEEGRASHLQTMSPDIQRVHVVNWPAGLGAASTAEASTEAPAATPMPGAPRARPARGSTAGSTATPLGAGTSGGDTGAGDGGSGAGASGSGTTGGDSRRSGTTFKRGTTEGSQAKFSALESVQDIQDTLDQANSNISEALQKSPVRALSVAMGQIAQTVIGGRDEILRNAAQARAKGRTAGVYLGELRGAEEQRDRLDLELSAMTGGESTPEGRARVAATFDDKTSELFKDLTKQFEDANERVETVRPIAEQKADEAKTASENILTTGQQIRSQAVGVAGIVGGTLLFTSAMSAAQVAMEQLGKVSMTTVDAMALFGFTAKKVVSDLASTVPAQGGNVEAALSAQQAALGLTGTTFETGALARQAGIVSGAQQWEQRRDLMRAARFTDMTSGQSAIPGLGVGVGNGVLNTWIGQTPGIAETIGGLLQSPDAASSQAVANSFQISPWDAAVRFLENAQEAVGLRDERASDPFDQAERIASANRAFESAVKGNQEVVDTFNRGVEDWVKFNGEVDPGRLIRTSNAELIAATTEAMKDAGVSDAVAKRYADANIAAVGPGGRSITGDDINKLLEFSARGANVPNAEQMVAAMENQLTAQIGSIFRGAELQRQLIPTNVAKSLIASPFPQSATTGITATSGVDPQAAQAAGRYEKSIQNTRDSLMQIRDEGLTELQNLGVPQSAIDSVVKLSDKISTLQTRANDLQLGLEQEQYNEQIRLSIRGISDLVAMNQKQAVSIGDQVIGASKLGQLMRAQVDDQRQLSRIQLARSQRELNLQIALSRLRSPGETPEERAVRRREAELLASEQQRELDIGKRSTRRGFQIQDIQFGRQLTDAVKQLELLQQGRAVSVEVRGIQKLVEAKQQMLQVKQAYMDTYSEAGVAVRKATLGIIDTLEARLGRLTSKSVQYVEDFVSGLVDAYKPLGSLFSGGRSQDPNKAGSERTRRAAGSQATFRASGGIDMVKSPTLFMAGEAGNEAVVVLKNPRMNSAPAGYGGGGGGGNLNVTVKIDANISGSADEDRLVRKVTRALHDEAALLVGG